jgi:hypothetical protein
MLPRSHARARLVGFDDGGNGGSRGRLRADRRRGQRPLLSAANTVGDGGTDSGAKGGLNTEHAAIEIAAVWSCASAGSEQERPPQRGWGAFHHRDGDLWSPRCLRAARGASTGGSVLHLAGAGTMLEVARFRGSPRRSEAVSARDWLRGGRRFLFPR